MTGPAPLSAMPASMRVTSSPPKLDAKPDATVISEAQHKLSVIMYGRLMWSPMAPKNTPATANHTCAGSGGGFVHAKPLEPVA